MQGVPKKTIQILSVLNWKNNIFMYNVLLNPYNQIYYLFKYFWYFQSKPLLYFCRFGFILQIQMKQAFL